MQKLEMERREAENNLQTLTSETERYKTSLHQQAQTQTMQHPHPRGDNYPHPRGDNLGGDNLRPNFRLETEEEEVGHTHGVGFGVGSPRHVPPQQSRGMKVNFHLPAFISFL
jgi:hypothetical protein